MSSVNQANTDTPSTLETLGIFAAIIVVVAFLGFVMIVLAAGAWVGWHELGPWIASGKSS